VTSCAALRPRSTATAPRRALLAEAAKAAQTGDDTGAIERLAKATPDKEEAAGHYRLGLCHMAAGRLDEAIESFNKAVALDCLLAEAYMGLGRAWKAKGRPDLHRRYLKEAAMAYARKRRFRAARAAMAEAMAQGREKNPFLDAGASLLRKGKTRAAAAAFRQAELLDGTDVLAAVARACHFTADPRQTAREMAMHLAEARGSRDHVALLRRLLGPEISAGEGYTPPPSFLARRFPRLHEVWTVVRYTAKTLRNGRPLHHPLPLEI